MIILLMGVSGSGKTTVGRVLAADLGWPFFDGDDFHPPENVEKMAQRIPLTDADRWPWLDALRAFMDECLEDGRDAVIACSALRQVYRDRLGLDRPGIHLVYLKGTFDLIRQRMDARENHFMPVALLHSQFDTLEEPEDAATVDIAAEPEAIAATIRELVGV